MAINVMLWVLEHSRSRHGARLTLIAIADNAGSDGGDAWPSVKELARKANISVTAVHAAIKELVRLGELEVTVGGGKPGPNGPTNMYRVIMRDYPDADVTERDDEMPGTPAESAPPADSVPLPDPHPSENGTPADSGGVQILKGRGTDSAPRTVLEPPENSPSESSIVHAATLFADDGPPPATQPRPNGATRRRMTRETALARFAEWYAAYPLHKARGRAETAFASAVRAGTDPDVLIAAAHSYRSDPDVVRGFPKHPATWLNGKCWLDEPAPDVAANGRTSQPPASRPRQWAEAGAELQRLIDNTERRQTA